MPAELVPAQLAPADLAAALRAARVVGVLRAPGPDAALDAARAALGAGLRALEVTFTTPGAPGVLAALRAEMPPGALLGAGTVMTVGDAEAAVGAGADFLVGPHLAEDVLAWAAAGGVPYIPGVLTPGEVARALSLGAGVVKLFPAGAVGGPAYLRGLLGPFPGLRVLATGGVQPGEVPAYLAAGALAVGLGSALFPGGADAARALRAAGVGA